MLCTKSYLFVAPQPHVERQIQRRDIQHRYVADDEAGLDDFVEVELRVGLETNTRIEILTGLAEEDRVAADPELIRRKLERKDRDDESSDEDKD